MKAIFLLCSNDMTLCLSGENVMHKPVSMVTFCLELKQEKKTKTNNMPVPLGCFRKPCLCFHYKSEQ